MAFTDDFTGSTTGTVLSSHTPTGGTAWTHQVIGASEFIIGDPAAAGAITLQAGGGAGYCLFVCDDQGSADHATILKRVDFSTFFSSTIAAVRAVDGDNWCGYRLFGTGGAGRRLTKRIAGTSSDIISSQGVSGEWVKVEAEGDKYRLYAGGTGAAPVWAQVGSEQTILTADLATSETSQGILSINTGILNTTLWAEYFEAAALGGGATLTTASLDATLDAVTASTTLTVDIEASLASTLDDATVSSSVGAGVDFSSTITLDDVTVSSAVAADIDATSTVTLDDATTDAALAVTVDAALDATLGDATVASTLAEAPATDVSFSASLDDAGVSSAVAVDVSASAAITTDDTTLDSSVAVNVNLAASPTLDDASVESLVVSAEIGLSADLALDGASVTSLLNKQEAKKGGGGSSRPKNWNPTPYERKGTEKLDAATKRRKLIAQAKAEDEHILGAIKLLLKEAA